MVSTHSGETGPTTLKFATLNPSPLERPAIALGWIGLVAAFLYLNTLSHGFVWDDYTYVLGNTHFQSGQNALLFFVSDFCKGVNEDCFFYRPLVSLTYLLDHTLWGTTPFGYHLTNIIFHIAVSLLVYQVIGVILHNKMAAFIGGTLFAIHPVHSESVSFVAARTDPPAVLFSLLALIFYIKKDQISGKPKVVFQVFSLICFLLALLAKEIAITLPLLFMVYSLLFPHPIRAKNEVVSRLKPSLPFWGVVIGYLFLRNNIFGDPFSGESLFDGILQRVFTAPLLFMENVRMLLIPWPLEVFRAPVGQKNLMDPWVLGAISFCFLLGWALLKFGKNSKETLFSMAWVLITLIPVLNLVPSPWPSVWDRFLYLPSIGLCFWVGWLGSQLLSKNGPKWNPFSRWIWATLGVVIFLLFSGLTLDRNKDWKDNITLWGVTMKHLPVGSWSWAIAGNNLAQGYQGQGNLGEAVRILEEVYAVRPGFLAASINLGNAYATLGNPKQALEVYHSLLHGQDETLFWDERRNLPEKKISPTQSPRLYYNLGVTYSSLGDYDHALDAFQKAMKLKPEDHLIYYSLGNLYSRTGHLEKAEQAYLDSIRLRPDFIEGYQNLGGIYVRQEALEKAVIAYQSAIRLGPPQGKAYQNLGWVYYQLGFYNQSAEILGEGIRRFPKDATLHYNLGLAYQKEGRVKDAREEYQKTILLEPNYWQVYNNLGSLKEMEGDPRGALEDYGKAVSLQPNFITAQVNLGRMLLETGQPQKALQHFNGMLKGLGAGEKENPETHFVEEQIKRLEKEVSLGENSH